ncbi:hypothetical protein C8R45DRAFT_974975 [Mycena sanguinolenta]|nr:hypothetical protein C8R45DRAFT_974975 [Mycena sanguinolenta]
MAASLSMRAALLEQRERTKQSSKADIERFIEESELKITSLEFQISALVDLRDRERTCVAALRNLIAPICTLPVESLVEIFELSIRDSTHVADVFRVAHVCTHWRQVAHGTPRLWTRPMGIELRRCKEQAYEDAWKAWLVRSAPLSVPVSLVLADKPIDVPDEILRTSPRWRTLRLDVPGYTSLSFVRQLAESAFDSLEDLDLGSLVFDEDEPTPSESLSFTTIPRLRTLSMGIPSNAISIIMPWAQLTDLTLACGDHIIFNILAQCTNLIKAHLSINGWDILPEARDILPLNHMRTLLVLFFGSTVHFMPFLNHLSAPALEELRLNFWTLGANVARWTKAHFTAFQLRAPDITHLELICSCLTSDDLRTAIRHAPSLTHLKITDCQDCIDDTLIEALYYKAGVSPLAPHLHNLLLHDIGDNLTETNLAGMIASRWWPDTDLASRLVQPVVARWTRVELRGRFSRQFVDILKDLPSDVLRYSM